MLILKKKEDCKLYKVTDETVDVFIESGPYNTILNCLIENKGCFKMAVINTKTKEEIIEFINDVNERVKLKDVTPLEKYKYWSFGSETFTDLDSEEIKSFKSSLPMICFFIQKSNRLLLAPNIENGVIIGESNNNYFAYSNLNGEYNVIVIKKPPIKIHDSFLKTDVDS